MKRKSNYLKKSLIDGGKGPIRFLRFKERLEGIKNNSEFFTLDVLFLSECQIP